MIVFDDILEGLLQKASSTLKQQHEDALIDLRLIIERFTQNRYRSDQSESYLQLFSDRNLISYRLKKEDFLYVKYYLFYMLFNMPDRAFFVAKCIKVMYDISSVEIIVAGIRHYMLKDDAVTAELIYALTDMAEEWQGYKRFNELFEEIIAHGGPIAVETTMNYLTFLKENGVV